MEHRPKAEGAAHGTATIVGHSLRVDGLLAKSHYDRIRKSGHLIVDIEAGSTLEQRRVLADLIRAFADELEEESQ